MICTVKESRRLFRKLDCTTKLGESPEGPFGHSLVTKGNSKLQVLKYISMRVLPRWLGLGFSKILFKCVIVLFIVSLEAHITAHDARC